MVQISLAAVVHGTLTPNGQSASLIITDFRVKSYHKSSRLKSLMIDYTFEGSDRPVVVDISPSDNKIIARTPEPWDPPDLSATKLEVGETEQTISSIVGNKFDLSKPSYKDKDNAILSGYIESHGGSYGKPNSARWVLNESKAQKNGIPTFLRTVILLERKGSAPKSDIRATIKINGSIDSHYDSTSLHHVQQLFGETSEKIVFDLKTQKWENEIIDDENLDTLDLDYFSAVGTEDPIP